MGERTYDITPLTIRGKEFPVQVKVHTAYNGEGPSSAEFVLVGVKTGKYDREVRSDSLEGLYALAMAATKKNAAKVSIPFMVVDYPRYYKANGARMKSGTIVGKHAGNGNIMLRWEGSTETEQATRHGRQDYFHPMSQVDSDRLVAIIAEEAALVKEREAIEVRYKFDPEAEIEAEQERVASQQEAVK